MQKLPLITLFSCCFFNAHLYAQDSNTANPASLCLPYLSKNLCTQMKDVIKTAAGKKPETADELWSYFQEELNKKKTDPDFVSAAMESPLIKNRLAALPFDVTVKVMDVKDQDSVLALEFGYNHQFSRNTYNTEGTRLKSYGFDFAIKGTATQDADENPRNLIESKLSFSFATKPNFSVQKIASSHYDKDRAKECTTNRDLEDDQECKLLEKLVFDELFEPAGLTYYFDYGVNAGYETDQAFKANNTTLSLFATTTFQDFRKSSFMGYNGIIPTFRINADSVEPSAETPRSLAGDDTSYTRLSAEFHLSVPLTQLLNTAYKFSFNYRTFDELDASDLVKTAGLDKYRLRTYSISSPTGLVVSYSSGRLPFGFANQQAVELGFHTYF